MRLFLAILIGKLILFITKYLKIGGGSAAPGYYALKIEPKLVEKLAGQVKNRIIVTGTNGKTTTSKLIYHFAKANGLKVIRNSTGSNLERGVASALISKSNVFGKLSQFDLSIWETDEAAFNVVAKQINPQIIVFLNVLRDQLDRYGEIDTIVKKWQKTLDGLDKNTTVLINNDDENLRELIYASKGKIQTFGLLDKIIGGEKHIGKKIPKAKTELEAKNIKENGLSSVSFELTINHQPLTINLPIPGIYHIYDFLAAFLGGINLGFSNEKMISSLKNYSPAFGRFEKFVLPNRDWKANSKPGLRYQNGYIFLIKNPAGATQVFQTIAPEIKAGDKLFFALNDNLADGRDVSWIWDAEFEGLSVKGKGLRVICSGTRAEDLALRLNYAGFDKDSIVIESDIKKALNLVKKISGKRVFIMPTYTALLELQKILTKNKLKDHYWRES